ncbi:MAG: pantoate--beta-alanine ligase [Gammaproteobacteria bacterium]|jgi:pantoate--beta-alanine ligase
MRQVRQIKEVREQLATVRQEGKTIALVPTMGNLHDGHLSLVKQAQECADYIVVTIFVNPTQFVEGEDFDSYPRTLDSDLSQLNNSDVDLVFIPDNDEIYPAKSDVLAEVTVPALDSIYCGEYRPGHFKGVATIVTKLLNIVQPDIAIFGRKDYQQLLVIRSLVKSLNLPIKIIGAETMREKDGLAMSSRNQYLTEKERKTASLLCETLKKVAKKVEKGADNHEKLEKEAISDLKSAGFRPEYLKICDSESLLVPKQGKLVIIAAAWLGKARLIDNVAVQPYD